MIYLAEWRAHRGLTQAALARTSEVHRVTVANIERGHYANQTLATLEKLAKALRVTIPDLFRLPAKPRRPAKSKRVRR